MIYYALAVITASSITVADVYTTREPCDRDRRALQAIWAQESVLARCIPTTQGTAESAEQQLINIGKLMERQ